MCRCILEDKNADLLMSHFLSKRRKLAHLFGVKSRMVKLFPSYEKELIFDLLMLSHVVKRFYILISDTD